MCATASDWSSGLTEEWLVADSRGGFAMGTTAGVRTRKYHGFYLGIAGRAETAFLTDFDLKLDGRELWPHRYGGADAAVVYPDPLRAATTFAYEPLKGLPRWRWEFSEGRLDFGIEPGSSGGIRLSWKWQGHSRAKRAVQLEIRPFWAMRPLHANGGKLWNLEIEGGSSDRLVSIASEEGQEAFCLLDGPWQWSEDPLWYRNFEYSEELARGYADREDLYSAGVFKVDLNSCAGGGASWVIADRREVIEQEAGADGSQPARIRSAALDYVLSKPAGICAGFPWFGEWGRDTFISLPDSRWHGSRRAEMPTRFGRGRASFCTAGASGSE